jgi:multicomponent K+:H+ antiporter subunit E
VRRLLPSPSLSVALFALWLLLMQSLEPGTLLLGAALALSWPALTAPLLTAPPRVKKPLVIAALLARVVHDMLLSNVKVSWLVLTRRSRALRSGFIRVPLELRDPNGLAALAMIITFTPGTAWAQLSTDGRILLVHVLLLETESSMVTFIRKRYEQPLREIFE